MGAIDNSLKTLKQKDFYSILLFSLYKLTDVPEYSSLCELTRVLDKESLLNLCEYFGGQTLKIPTITDLENLVYALLLYQYVNLEHIEYEKACKEISKEHKDLTQVKTFYRNLVKVLKDYKIRIGDENE